MLSLCRGTTGCDSKWGNPWLKNNEFSYGAARCFRLGVFKFLSLSNLGAGPERWPMGGMSLPVSPLGPRIKR